MLRIRLQRFGAKNEPTYRLVVAEQSIRRDGRFVERVGFYNPIAAGGEEGLRFDLARFNYWKGVGAQVSPSVERLLKQYTKKNATAAAPAAA